MLAEVMHSDAAAIRREVLPAGLLRLASDERLVEQVRAGSERAFEALFDRHHRPVLAFCRHMLGSAADAEDAVQHTFLAAYRDLVRSEKPIVLRPWLYAIARHRCLSVLSRRREQAVEELPEAATDSLAAHVGTREDLRATLADVAQLPDDQRAALVLAQLGDVSHEEIARILGCRREKVKALVFQARSSLAHGRVARETPCAEIREQIATLGGALRHTALRRHLRDCPGCRAFHHQIRIQRRRLSALLPVAPTVGLKRAVLGAVSGWGGGGAGGVAVTAGGLGGGGLAATALVAVAITSGGIAASVTAAAGGREPSRPVPAATATAREPAPASAVPARARYERTPPRPAREDAAAALPPTGVPLAGEPAARGKAKTSGEENRSAAPEQTTGRGPAERRNSSGHATGRSHAEQASSSGQAKGRSHADRRHSRGQTKPRTPVEANGQVKSGKSAKPPNANGKVKPATPDNHATTPSAPAPEANPVPAAASAPSPRSPHRAAPTTGPRQPTT